MRFRDRTEAGRKLAENLAQYRGQPGVVYALPRGGVVLGVEVAQALDMPLDLVIPRKIGHPRNAEYAIGAVTEDGERVCNEWEVSRIDPAWLEREVEAERWEAQRRREKYLHGRAPLPVEGRIAIIVDDGIATGLTMRAAILEVKKRRPAKIIVAVPVAPLDTAMELRKLADDVVGVDISADYRGAVGAYYLDFAQVSDTEVIQYLDKFQAGVN